MCVRTLAFSTILIPVLCLDGDSLVGKVKSPLHDPSVNDTYEIRLEDVIYGLFGLNRLKYMDPIIMTKHPPGVRESCLLDARLYFKTLSSYSLFDNDETDKHHSHEWAIKAFDACGKPGSGLYSGTAQFVGKYDQCLSTHASVPAGTNISGDVVQVGRSFGMRYCRVQISGDWFRHVIFKDTNPYWAGQEGPQAYINWGICLPETCDSHDIRSYLNNETFKVLSTFPVHDVICDEHAALADDAGAIYIICVLAIIAATVLICTITDVISDQSDSLKILIIHFGNTPEAQIGMEKIDVCADNLACDIQLDENKTLESEDKHEDKENAKTGMVADDDLDGKDNDVEKTKKLDVEKVDETELNKGENVDLTSMQDGGDGGKDYTFINLELEPDNKVDNTEHNMSQHTSSKSDVTNTSKTSSTSRDASRQTSSTIWSYVKAFSLYTNFRKLISTSGEGYTCIYGIRVISMLWIILGHTYTFGAILDETNIMFENPSHLPAHIGSAGFQLVGSANLAVDSFFLMSAFLIMQKCLREYSPIKDKPIKAKISFWSMYYVNRFWRLTPVYAVVLFSGMFLYDHVVAGPLKADRFEEYYDCRDKWWSHLLYFNNFYQPRKKCMTWSWYLAVDTQFYMISPFFITQVIRNKKIGLLLITLALAGSMLGAVISQALTGGTFIMMDVSYVDYWQWVYSVPWTRGAPYCIGLILGVLMSEPKSLPDVSKKVSAITWPSAILVALLLVFLPLDQWSPSSQHWPRLAQAVYEALSRPVWSVCVAWVIYACCTGRGGIVNTILSWSSFTCPARLVYCMYLIHPVVITFVTYSRRDTIFMDPAHLTIMYNYLGNLVLTSLVALLLCLTVESPGMALGKKLFGRRQK